MNNQKLIANIAKILVFFTADVNIFMNLLSRLFHLKPTHTQIPPTGRCMLWHVMGANPQAPEILQSHRRDAIICPHTVLPPCPHAAQTRHRRWHIMDNSMQAKPKPKRSLEKAVAVAVSLGEGRSWQVTTKFLIHPPG